MDSYYGKTRFQSEEEAGSRRTGFGKRGQILADWAASRAAEYSQGGIAIDLACGNGRLMDALSQTGATVVGGDISAAMLRKAAEILDDKGPFRLVRLEAENLPFPTRSVEVIFCFRFLHHVPSREIEEQVLGEMFRVARKAIVLSYKAHFTHEHLKKICKRVLRRKRRLGAWRYSGSSQLAEVADSRGWRIVNRFAVHGFLSANRAIVFEPVHNDNREMFRHAF